MAAKKPDLLPEIDIRNQGKPDRPGQDIRWLLSEIRQLRREMHALKVLLDYEHRSWWTKLRVRWTMFRVKRYMRQNMED